MSATVVDGQAGPTVAVAFGGGGARGLAHIHVIEALDELGVRPVAIAGTSIGAIMGAGMAAGMTGRQIGDYARSILSRRAEFIGRMWSARPTSFTEMVGGLKVSQFSIERILHAFLPHQIPHGFEDLAIPLQVTATDYYGHHVKVFSEGELRPALAASAAIPAVFSPVIRDGRTYIDGGIYNPVPFDLLKGLADIVMAIDVVGAPEEVEGRKPTSIDLMFGSTQILMQSIIAHKVEQCAPDILLRPPVSKYRALDFLKIDALMSETASIKDEVKRAVEAAMASRARARA
ncbi:patatin-like phospholipase family protein [Mesorhizobium sp. ZMM04-5]|uniref:Patatin-like phospholipase family protein n=1 Tax=Mesorhizobium marinum TaxID=3228790 RepID=A0ABV3R030_9HYPH